MALEMEFLGSMYWMQRTALLTTFLSMGGGDIPASAYKQGIVVAILICGYDGCQARV